MPVPSSHQSSEQDDIKKLKEEMKNIEEELKKPDQDPDSFMGEVLKNFLITKQISENDIFKWAILKEIKKTKEIALERWHQLDKAIREKEGQ